LILILNWNWAVGFGTCKKTFCFCWFCTGRLVLGLVKKTLEGVFVFVGFVRGGWFLGLVKESFLFLLVLRVGWFCKVVI
jgi:hypothetical protein